MSTALRSRLRALVLRVPRWLVVLVGLNVLIRVSIAAMGGYDRVWLFERMAASRFTSMAMLTGTLRLRSGLQHVGGDEQVYNGAAYTNWGFGVPLLQMPFHWFAAHSPKYPSKFFPDRAIYFFYLLVLIPILWAALDRVLARREGPRMPVLRRNLLSWSATLLVLVCALYPLMSCRFLIYEETIAYMIVFELLALSAYAFAAPTWRSGAVASMGAAAGMGLLIRPIGLIYVGVWGLLVLLEGRRIKPALVFAAALSPFLAFWLYSNTVRSGSPFAFGISNSLPGIPYHLPIIRFGNLCADTRAHFFEAAWQLFRGLFLNVNDAPPPLPPLPSASPAHALPPPELWLKKCHFEFEVRPPAGQPSGLEPFLGTGVLLVLAWMLLHYLVRRERRLSYYVPIGSFAFLFYCYASRAPGFCWRYAGDFWPLVVLACVKYARWLPRNSERPKELPLALAFALSSFALYERDIDPALSTTEAIDPNDPAIPRTAMWDEFTNARYSLDPSLPSSAKCGDRLTWPLHNGQGWSSSWAPGCGVDTATLIYLGVPRKTQGRYVLRFSTKGISASSLRVNVNGRMYEAQRSGDEYSVPVEIRYEALTSPIVMTTIEWTHTPVPPVGVELLSIELV